MKNFAIFTIFFVFTLLFFEIYLRFTEIILPSYVYDNKELGRTHKPSAQVNLIEAEGFYMGEINYLGYTGPAYPKEKNKDAIRIALIGDSYIEGFQLFERHHFRGYLESGLSKSLNKKIEVLNFGIGGVDLRGMYLIYLKKVMDCNPDIVLFFVKKDDLVNKDVLPTPEAYLDKGEINFNSDFLNNQDAKLRQKFAFVRDYSIGNLFKEVFEVYHTGLLFNKILDKLSFNTPLNESKKPVDYNENKDMFFQLNKEILKELNSKDNTMYHPIIVKVNDFPLYYEELLDSFNIIQFPLKQELGKYSLQDLTYWKASKKLGHWNHYAHKIVGKYLKEEIITFVNKISSTD